MDKGLDWTIANLNLTEFFSNLFILYLGCYRFENENENETFMLFLDNKTCPQDNCSHNFFAPIFFGNNNCSIEWSNTTHIPPNGERWKNLSGIPQKGQFSVTRYSNDTKKLEVRQTNKPTKYTYLLCRPRSNLTYTLLVKFFRCISRRSEILMDPCWS